MFNNDYPYTNAHELNLDWIIKEVKEFGKKVEPATAEKLGIVKPDNETIVVDDRGVISSVLQSEPATSTTNGIVRPDNETIRVSNDGKLSVIPQTIPVATPNSTGIVKPDNTTIAVSTEGEISAIPTPIATSNSVGTVKPDNITISVDSNGKLSTTNTGNIPIATTSTLGGVIPDGISLAVDIDGKIYVTGQAPTGGYVLPIASNTRLGGIRVDNDTLEIDSTTGVLSVVDGHYQLPTASSVVKGGVKIGENVDVSSDGTISVDLDSLITNMVNPSASSTTISGITISNNGDGTYTVNGTASGNVSYTIVNVANGLKIGDTVKLLGCPSGGSRETYRISGYYLTDDFGNGSINTVTHEVLNLQIYITNGTTVNNLVFKPMITTDLNATYDDFVPYTGSTGKLNSDVAEINKLVQSQITPIGIYCYQNIIKKRNGIVQLSINAVVSGSDITQSTQIGTIPEGYRPLETENIAIYDNTSKTTNRLIIGTDGKITVQPTTTLTSAASNIQFNTTWII